MKTRHAAALALVGWFLIVAPLRSVKDNKYQEVPLREWTDKAIFDSGSECNQEISKECHHFDNGEVGGLRCEPYTICARMNSSAFLMIAREVSSSFSVSKPCTPSG